VAGDDDSFATVANETNVGHQVVAEWTPVLAFERFASGDVELLLDLVVYDSVDSGHGVDDDGAVQRVLDGEFGFGKHAIVSFAGRDEVRFLVGMVVEVRDVGYDEVLRHLVDRLEVTERTVVVEIDVDEPGVWELEGESGLKSPRKPLDEDGRFVF